MIIIDELVHFHRKNHQQQVFNCIRNGAHQQLLKKDWKLKKKQSTSYIWAKKWMVHDELCFVNVNDIIKWASNDVLKTSTSLKALCVLALTYQLTASWCAIPAKWNVLWLLCSCYSGSFRVSHPCSTILISIIAQSHICLMDFTELLFVQRGFERVEMLTSYVVSISSLFINGFIETTHLEM